MNEHGTNPKPKAESFYGSPLPDCIQQVRLAAERLYRTVHDTPFPNLTIEPKDDAQARGILEHARKWALAVQNAYGDPHVDRRFPTDSLWSYFAVPPLRHVMAKPMQTIRMELRTDSLHLMRNQVELQWREPIPVEVSWGAGRPTLDHATNILGEIPDQFRYLLYDAIPDPGRLGHEDLVQWAARRDEVRVAIAVIRAKALGLVAWVRSRIRDLESALVPRIRCLRQLPSGARFLEIEQAGGRREVRVRKAVYWFLDDLVKQGKSTESRPVKKQLIDAIPELGPWIGTTSSSTAISASNRAVYHLSEVVQARLEPDWGEMQRD